MLSSMLKEKICSENNKIIRWEYHFPYQYKSNDDVVTCQNFLCKVMDIKRARFITLQQKIKNNESLGDKRGGNQQNNFLKLTEDVKKLIYAHCESLAHSESHYTRESSKLKYFKESELNLKTLYDKFKQYYTSETGNVAVPIKFSTYSKYFNYFVDFTFQMPRTDVCNECYEYEKLGEKNGNAARMHINKVNNYVKMKKEMLSTFEDNLCCEFDFGQNLPLPKLPVSAQFYLRLVWLHIFNVHIHKTDRSYMFPFMEGYLNKGGNTVCNLVLYTILEELKLKCYNKIVLFSDACGGQNRNYILC